jgi:hypothetical protein
MLIPLNQVPVTLVASRQGTAFNPPIPAASTTPAPKPSGHRLSSRACTHLLIGEPIAEPPQGLGAPVNIINLSQGDKHIGSFIPGMLTVAKRHNLTKAGNGTTFQAAMRSITGTSTAAR